MLLVTLFTDGYEWWVIAGIAAFFMAAYWIWPSKRKGQRHDNYVFLDLVEMVVELPARITLGFLRIVGGIFGDFD